MSSLGDWVVPPAVQPHAEDYDFNLEAALSSVVGVRSLIPSDAFTAETLGNERHGNGVLLSGGLVLTIGYLIVEAEIIWLSFPMGRRYRGTRWDMISKPVSHWSSRLPGWIFLSSKSGVQLTPRLTTVS